MAQGGCEVFSVKSQADRDARRASLRGALSGASRGDLDELEKLSDPFMLRDAINSAIARVEGAERLIPGKFYGALGEFAPERFEERGLPELTPEKTREWAKALLGAGQEHPLKKDLADLEMAILRGEAEMARQILSRSPMAPWVMDFSLREYEAENLMTFAAKYAPAPADFEIIDALLAEGLRAPDRSAYARLEAPALASAMPGFTHKGARRVGECLERAGWSFGFVDYLLLFAKAREELDQAGMPGERMRDDLLGQKIEMALWLAERGVSPRERLPVGEAEADWEMILMPAQASWVRRERERLAGLGEAMSFGLEEVFSRPGAPMRKEAQWAALGPWMLQAGLDVSAIEARAREAGLAVTADCALPWAQKQQLEAVCEAGQAQGAGEAGPARL